MNLPPQSSPVSRQAIPMVASSTGDGIQLAADCEAFQKFDEDENNGKRHWKCDNKGKFLKYKAPNWVDMPNYPCQ